jgi:DNA (cytosine-5)-methyltransferase 1
MRKLRLLDLCCGAGGCSVGYYRAARKMGIELEITGVDINDQPNYPFYFEKADAVKFFEDNSKYFSHIHASPPCQAFSCATGSYRNIGNVYYSNLTEIRDIMYKSGLPGVIENVCGAHIPGDQVLNGQMFGLKVIRKRKFEYVNWFDFKIGAGSIKPGLVRSGECVSVYGHGGLIARHSNNKILVTGSTVRDKWSNAMGIDWMTRKELAQAIPPAYTEFIGLEFLKR